MRFPIGSKVRAAGLLGLLTALVSVVGCEEPKPISPEPTSPESESATRVLIVHSYSDVFQWTHELNEGIIEGLSRAGYTEGQEYKLETFFMDTRLTYTSPEQVSQRAAEALEMMKSFAPDILFVTDDNALKEVAVSYALENPGRSVPMVFSGINVDPSIYAPIQTLDAPGGPITGVLERIPYFEIFELGKRLFPDASKIVILADGGSSSNFVAGTFQEDYLDSESQPLEVVDFILFQTFAAWKEAVLEYQDKADIIGILNYHQLTDEDGSIVASRDVVKWMTENNMLPELGLVSEWAEDGILVSAGNSGYKTGIYAGVLGGDILNGRDPGTVPIIDAKEIDAKYNLRRARMLGIDFPPGELVAAAEVFHTIGSEK